MKVQWQVLQSSSRLAPNTFRAALCRCDKATLRRVENVTSSSARYIACLFHGAGVKLTVKLPGHRIAQFPAHIQRHKINVVAGV